MAAALFKKTNGSEMEAVSAGIKLSGPSQTLEELRPATDNVLEVMKEEGLDVSKEIRTQIDEKMAGEADKIILAVDESDYLPDYLINNPKVTNWEVADPKGKSLEETRNIKDRIKELIFGLKFV